MVTVYGADWCEDTQRSLRHLRRLGVAYDYVNVDRDPDALERAKAMNAGRRRTPTIDLDGVTLVEPSTRQLTEALEQRHQVQHAQVERRLRFNNVGDLERVLRVAGGTAALLVAARLKGAWKWPLAAWGAFEVASGGLGSCPVYTARGVTSLAGPGDHPREAERRSWLAPAG